MIQYVNHYSVPQRKSMGRRVYLRENLHSVQGHVILYIQHSRISWCNFIPCLSWSTSPPCPSNAISIHFFTQLSLSILSTCPNHLSLPHFYAVSMLTTLHIYGTIIVSFLASFDTTSSFTGQVSLHS